MGTKKTKMDRRQMLSLFGVAAGASLLDSPLAWFTRSVLDGLVSQAYAQTAGVTARRYLNIQQPGAPSRWTWDLFLTPYTTTNFRANGQIGTRYTGAGPYTGVEYATVLREGINCPWLWQFDVPRAGSGTRPMTDLLKNLLVLQGITTNTPSHTAAQGFHFKPTGASQTLGALTPDALNDLPIAAVNAGAQQFSFLSKKGRSVTAVNTSGNWIDNLMAPFKDSTVGTTFAANQQKVQALMDQTANSLDKIAADTHVLGDALGQSRQSAKDAANFLRNAPDNLATVWDDLLTKYQDLVKRAFNQGTILAGINDKPIGTTGARGDDYLISNGSRATGADLRTGIVANTTVGNMAQVFALAEYVLTNNISRSVTGRINGVQGLSTAVFGNASLPHDEHFSGRMVVLLLNSMYYRAYSACLLELIDRLKAKGIWQDTVIDIGGEFNREGKATGGGSDHGWMGKSVAYYSGAITGPLILGSMQNETASAHAGTWGKGAPDSKLGTQVNMASMAATCAQLLGVPSPVTSATTTVLLGSGGTLTPLIDKARIV